jgi:hypothetical protein
MLKLFVIIILGCLLLLSACAQSQETTTNEPGPYDDFAACLKESGLKIYGSMTCSVCKRQRALFDRSFEILGEIECHPRGENPQTQLCFELGIEKTPTWVMWDGEEEVQRLEGFQNLETLAEVSGCALNG